MKSIRITAIALGSFIAAGAMLAVPASAQVPPGKEKCYGIAPASQDGRHRADGHGAWHVNE